VKKKGGATLVGVKTNLVDQIWGKDRPSRPYERVKALGLEFSGKKFQEKIDDLRKELEKKKSAGLVVCTCSVILILTIKSTGATKDLILTVFNKAMLDEVAWLFNLRGNEYALQVSTFTLIAS